MKQKYVKIDQNYSSKILVKKLNTENFMTY